MHTSENLNELALIRLIAEKSMTSGHKGTVKAIGDDCAILAPEPGYQLAVTTDTLVEGVHFDLAYFTPYLLGRKTAAVNLSDLASMGAQPKWAVLNLAVKKGCTKDFWLAFIDGLLSRLHPAGAALVGGDTVSSHEFLTITLTLIGEIKPGTAMTRSGAGHGDIIFCSGYLGEAAAGLKILFEKRKTKWRSKQFKSLIKRHLDPEPQLALGSALSHSGLVTACIDLSDGLATDLAHICRQSSVNAVITKDLLPVSRALKTAARELGISTTRLAISGGEDYTLLWTAKHENCKAITEIVLSCTGHPPFMLGKMIEGNDEVVLLDSHGRLQNIAYLGYEHIF